jgi:hypothetical protein
MEHFPATFFTSTTKYPDSGIRIQMGRSYQFDAPASAPDQRLFNLKLPGLAYFCDAAGAIDLTQSPERNMAVLEAFYNVHKRAKSFIFTHPVYGERTVKFNRPLQVPQGIIDGDGALEKLELELIELP